MATVNQAKADVQAKRAPVVVDQQGRLAKADGSNTGGSSKIVAVGVAAAVALGLYGAVNAMNKGSESSSNNGDNNTSDGAEGNKDGDDDGVVDPVVIKPDLLPDAPIIVDGDLDTREPATPGVGETLVFEEILPSDSVEDAMNKLARNTAKLIALNGEDDVAIISDKGISDDKGTD